MNTQTKTTSQTCHWKQEIYKVFSETKSENATDCSIMPQAEPLQRQTPWSSSGQRLMTG